MFSQSSQDTQMPKDHMFSQECVKPNVWGKLCPLRENFPCLGNALWLWHVVDVLGIFVVLSGTSCKIQRELTYSTRMPSLHIIMMLCV
jgi:hypothetical protein